MANALQCLSRYGIFIVNEYYGFIESCARQ